jgi:hypothetical protein
VAGVAALDVLSNATIGGLLIQLARLEQKIGECDPLFVAVGSDAVLSPQLLEWTAEEQQIATSWLATFLETAEAYVLPDPSDVVAGTSRRALRDLAAVIDSGARRRHSERSR